MLQASLVSGFGAHGIGGGDGWAGFGAASDAVRDLQNALKAYAATGHADADPGAVDGIVGPLTRNAVAAVVAKIPGLPDYVRTAIAVGVTASSFDARATALLDGAITSYASQIATAIKAVLVITGGGAGTGAGTTTSQTHVYQFDPGALARIAAEMAQKGEAGGGAGGTGSKSLFSIPVGKSWYQTWWGAGALVVGGLGIAATAATLILRRR